MEKKGGTKKADVRDADGRPAGLCELLHLLRCRALRGLPAQGQPTHAKGASNSTNVTCARSLPAQESRKGLPLCLTVCLCHFQLPRLRTPFNFFFFLFFRAHRTNDLTKKLEKVGPFECDELEKHCRVGAKCYSTKVHALYTMTKRKRTPRVVMPNVSCQM